MPGIESLLRDEMTRRARRVIRKALTKPLDELKRLKARLASLQSEINALKLAQARAQAEKRMVRAAEELPPAATGKVRVSPNLIKKLRKRLDITQSELARLVGVTDTAVGYWESGKTAPRPQAKLKIAALRKLGRRDVRRILEEQEAQRRARAASEAKPRRGRPARKAPGRKKASRG